MQNDFFRPDGKLTARVTSAGGWLDLSARKLVVAPAKLLETLQMLPKTSDFRHLASSIKGQPSNHHT